MSAVARQKLSACLLTSLLLAGCSGEKKTQTVGIVPQRQADPTAAEIPRSEAADPCALQMQDICGAMLLYYTLNHQMPQTLNELLPFADELTTLHFACPTDGKPYVYNAAGLSNPKLEKRLVLYDAESVHNGHRWGIVMAPRQPGKPMLMWVIPVTDAVLKLYESGQ